MFADIEKTAQLLEEAGRDLTVLQRLRRIADCFPCDVVFTTSFGIEDQVITHIIATEKLPFRILTLDTGRFFPETYDLWARTEQKYGLRIRAFYPHANALEALIADQGINGFYYSRQMRQSCCAVRKVEPLQRALKGAKVWLTGMRRDQSAARQNVQFTAYDKQRGLLKINPLYDLGRDDINAYAKSANVPVNVLHAAGFLSIGCACCTRSIAPGEDERAGRWWWETDSAKECGLHNTKADARSTPAGQSTPLPL